MSRQQRSHRKQRTLQAQNAVAPQLLVAFRAERNRNRVATVARVDWRAANPVPTPSTVADAIRTNHPAMHCSATDTTASNVAKAEAYAERAALRNGITAYDDSTARDYGFRYVLYRAMSDVYCHPRDTDNRAWNHPMLPVQTFSVAEYGSMARATAWEAYKDASHNRGQSVALLRYHDRETSDTLTQGDCRLRMAMWQNLTVAKHRKMAETLIPAEQPQPDAYAAFRAEQYRATATALLSDGFIDAPYVVVASVSDSAR
jgi:hypothetical protein